MFFAFRYNDIFTNTFHHILRIFTDSLLIFSFAGFWKYGEKAVEKLFNTIMLRAVISIVISLTFSVFTMIYSLTKDKSFFIIAFLQVVCFARIYLKFGDIMSMFSLQSNESRFFRKKYFKKASYDDRF